MLLCAPCDVVVIVAVAVRVDVDADFALRCLMLVRRVSFVQPVVTHPNGRGLRVHAILERADENGDQEVG